MLLVCYAREGTPAHRHANTPNPPLLLIFTGSHKAVDNVRTIKKLMEDGTEQEGTNFPVSIGPAKVCY